MNAVGMITNIVRENGERVRYTLDGLDRLVGEEVRDASEQVLYSATYSFDLAGNRTRTVIDSVTSDYTLGQGNRLAAFGSEGYVGYNAAGCVTTLIYSVSQRLDLTWNGQYELNATATNGGACERFGYDAMGRRAWTWDGAATNWYVYDGAQVVADVDATGGLVRTYVWGPGIDNLLAMTVYTGATAATYYAIKDHLGTVHALVTGNGTVIESYRFDAWGRVLGGYDSTGTTIAVSQIGNRYLWQGREYSWQTGFYYFRARWHDPVTGRWLSNDPIGISGGLNQYVFCADDPVNNRDPEGLTAGALALPWIGGGTAAGSGALAGLGPAAAIVGAGYAGVAAGHWLDETFGVSDWIASKVSEQIFPIQGERGQTARPDGTANPWKHRRPHPKDPKKILEKDPHTGKWKEKPKLPGAPWNVIPPFNSEEKFNDSDKCK